MALVFAIEAARERDANGRTGTLVATKAFVDRMSGDEAIAAGVAGPEIADDVVGDIGGRFRGHH